MTDYRLQPESGSLEVKGKDVKMQVRYPWTGKPWAAAAEAANNGLQGQGYIVHAVMMANRWGLPLAITVIALMVVQIAVTIWAALR